MGPAVAAGAAARAGVLGRGAGAAPGRERLARLARAHEWEAHREKGYHEWRGHECE